MPTPTIEHLVDDLIQQTRNTAYDGTLKERDRETNRVALAEARERVINHFHKSIHIAQQEARGPKK